MSSINTSSSVDVLPNEAVEALRRTRPWMLFMAIVAMIGALGSIIYGLYFALIIREDHFASVIGGSFPERLVAEVMLFGLLQALLAVMQFRFAAGLSRLSATEDSQSSVDVEQICRRQQQLWATLTVVMGAYVAFGLFHLVGLAAHTAW